MCTPSEDMIYLLIVLTGNGDVGDIWPVANIQQQKRPTAPIMTAVLLVTVKLWHFWGSDDGELLLIGLLPASFSLGRRIIILYK